MPVITANIYDSSHTLIQTIEYSGLDIYLQRISSDIAFLTGFLVSCFVALVFWNQVKGSAS